MAVTTMLLISKLKTAITRDFSGYIFQKGDHFIWDPNHSTITHPAINSPEALWSLLHEVSHGELGHVSFAADIDLIRHETAAWQYAVTTLAPRYGQVISQDYIEDHLDTYRLWLHTRSRCPTCQQNGIQNTQSTYRCINCRCLWRVNEARVCRLQRVKLRDQSRSE